MPQWSLLQTVDYSDARFSPGEWCGVIFKTAHTFKSSFSAPFLISNTKGMQGELLKDPHNVVKVIQTRKSR